MGNHLLICIHNKPAWSAYLLSHVVEVPPHLKVCIYTLTHTYNAHTCNAHTLLQTHTIHATHIIITHMPCTRTCTHTHAHTHTCTCTHIHTFTFIHTCTHSILYVATVRSHLKDDAIMRRRVRPTAKGTTRR